GPRPPGGPGLRECDREGQRKPRRARQREPGQRKGQRQVRRDEQGMVRRRAAERRLSTREKNHIDWRAGEGLPGPPVRERNPCPDYSNSTGSASSTTFPHCCKASTTPCSSRSSASSSDSSSVRSS